MKLIAGLGNPGKEYEQTRHNVGFLCLDALRNELGFPEFQLQKKFSSLTSEGEFNNEKILLIKPRTFMNLSGKAIQSLVNFYHVEANDLWVIYDDVDLPLGDIRIRPGGSAGSHNGMKSIVSSLSFNNFPRIRIGIESRGESAPQLQDTSSFVLNKFAKEETPLVKKAVKQAFRALLFALKHGVKSSMNKFN